MPLYDYKCEKDGYFELTQAMKDHAKGTCPTCGSDCKQVMITAPGVGIERMADAGCPGALETSGNRIEKRHKAAGQDHHQWRDDIPKKVADSTQRKMAESSAWE